MSGAPFPLSSVFKPGIYAVTEEVSVEAVTEWARSHGVYFSQLQGERISTSHNFMTEIADALSFPSYFGKNWDALDECLRDLEWLPANGYLIFFEKVDTFAITEPHSFAIALRVFKWAIEHWESHGVPMFILLSGSPEVSSRHAIPVLS